MNMRLLTVGIAIVILLCASSYSDSVRIDRKHIENILIFEEQAASTGTMTYYMGIPDSGFRVVLPENRFEKRTIETSHIAERKLLLKRFTGRREQLSPGAKKDFSLNEYLAGRVPTFSTGALKGAGENISGRTETRNEQISPSAAGGQISKSSSEQNSKKDSKLPVTKPSPEPAPSTPSSESSRAAILQSQLTNAAARYVESEGWMIGVYLGSIRVEGEFGLSDTYHVIRLSGSYPDKMIIEDSGISGWDRFSYDEIFYYRDSFSGVDIISSYGTVSFVSEPFSLDSDLERRILNRFK